MLAKNIYSKVAFITSDDLVIQPSTEQIIEKANGIKFRTKYFDNKKEAKKWILQKSE